MNLKVLIGIAVLVLLLAGAFFVFRLVEQTPPPDTAGNILVPLIQNATVLPYGTVVLSMGELAQFKNISILPIGIVEDSRCPIDVQCIQAGTVRVKVEMVSGQGTSTSILTLGQAFTTEGERITLVTVYPQKHSQKEITMGGYLLMFEVVPQTTPISTTPSSKCYIGGCSAQLCSDEPGMASTCEYTESYACYKTATCERQTDGKCGWTPTAELSACLTNS